jgi:hypothetical protein
MLVPLFELISFPIYRAIIVPIGLQRTLCQATSN